MTMTSELGKTVATAIILGAAVVAINATDVQAAATQSLESNAVVNFIENTTPTKPVDPENPNPGKPVGPIDPTKPGGPNPGTQGPLSIDFASSLQFGTSKITTTGEVYSAYAQEVVSDGVSSFRPQYVQVTDNRGTDAGWKLTVNQEQQLTSTAGKELEGAVITLENATVKTVEGSTIKAPSTAPKSIELVPGQEVSVMSAAQGEGAGLWVNHFGNSAATVVDGTDWKPGEEGNDPTEFAVKRNNAVTLAIPGKSNKSAAEYRSVLKWTLSEVADNGSEEEGED
ncbi:WxL domain-containing protein [Brochothrix thermosphacta]|uniref:WxL domain-containing protein n=1 Tax=Brochothrix thermosphacta TaxID=2756 RepID=UPI000A87CF8B|nr:WxL domain-containing protein [Brochothrix thermosphacta]